MTRAEALAYAISYLVTYGIDAEAQKASTILERMLNQEVGKRYRSMIDYRINKCEALWKQLKRTSPKRARELLAKADEMTIRATYRCGQGDMADDVWSEVCAARTRVSAETDECAARTRISPTTEECAARTP